MEENNMKEMDRSEADKLRGEMVQCLADLIKRASILIDSGHGDSISSSLMVIANFIIVKIANNELNQIDKLIDVIVASEKERSERDGDVITQELIKIIESKNKVIIH